MYRTAEYHDGETIRIQESRRRRRRLSAAERGEPFTASRHCDRTIGYRDDSAARKKDLLEGQSTYLRSTVVEKRDMGGSLHVTSSPSRSLKTPLQPVIVQITANVEDKKKTDIPRIEPYAMPTPPPTPKIERLSTPELSDLEDSPFCECCASVHVTKYCASCGIELNRT